MNAVSLQKIPPEEFPQKARHEFLKYFYHKYTIYLGSDEDHFYFGSNFHVCGRITGLRSVTSFPEFYSDILRARRFLAREYVELKEISGLTSSIRDLRYKIQCLLEGKSSRRSYELENLTTQSDLKKCLRMPAGIYAVSDSDDDTGD